MGRETFPLKYLTRARRDISAGHDHQACSPHFHGHLYTVTVTATGQDAAPLQHAWPIVDEYDRRTLNDMLGPAVPPTVFGLANILHERLVMVVPGFHSVEVEEHGGPSAYIERPDD